MMRRYLGQAASAARGITITGATNATPIVATLGANHGVPSLAQADQSYDALRRFTIFGITGNLAANGLWSLRSTGTNTFALQGSAGSGSPTMTNAVIAALMDDTPFMKGHAAVAWAATAIDSAPFDGTFAVMGNRADATDAEILASDATTLATFFEDCVTDVPWGVPGDGGAGTTDGTAEIRNIRLRRHMYLNVSARTAGTLEVSLVV